MSTDEIYTESDYKRPGVPKAKQTNVLLVREPVGAVRPSTHNLPGDNFTYGRKEQGGLGNGVKDCLRDWNDHLPEKNRIRPTYTKPLDPEVPYGKPSDKSTPMDALITNQYQREAIMTQRSQTSSFVSSDPAVAQRAMAKEANARVNDRVRNGVPHTKASLGHTVKKPEEPQEPFKMSRFKDVPSRIRLVNQTGSLSGTSTGSVLASSGRMTTQQSDAEGHAMEM